MLPELADALTAELEELAGRIRLRTLPAFAGRGRIHPEIDGRRVLNFSSNDYLGLAEHPTVLAAAQASLSSTAFGAAASRLVSGDLPAHRSLEAHLADFLETESALLFPTGYQTNLGVLTALAGSDDLIVSDALNHASLIDGCRLSRATVRVFAHLDINAARAALADRSRAFRRRFLVTESLFSMDGDQAPLADYAAIARAARAALIVDEAHALGVLGPSGRGLCAAAGIAPDALIGTLGKSLGSAGGFVAGQHLLRRILINRARTLLFTTASPPAAAAAAEAALTIVRSPEGDSRRAIIKAHVARLTDGPRFSGAHPTGPIIPLIMGSDGDAVAAGRKLLENGLFVQPIRPPTVPEGTARLRITLSALHTSEDIARLAEALARLPAPAADRSLSGSGPLP